MTKRQTRLFFLGSTLVFALIFIGLTLDTHRQITTLTNADQLTADVVAGKRVWHEKNCTNCHTLLGEGAYYAPDLTKIAAQRGAGYLSQFLKNPATFYSEEKDRRLMPNLNLRDDQIRQLIAFLTWVGQIDTDGWPPRPLLVTGTFPGANTVRAGQEAVSTDPVALGEALFRTSPPACSGCHSTAKDVQLVGPSLADIATRAGERIKDPSYRGRAKTAEEYVRESILTPSAFLVAGPTFSAAGRSFMPDNFEHSLQANQIDQLVAYLMTLK
jgi:nitric oxide reductase subunit C